MPRVTAILALVLNAVSATLAFAQALPSSPSPHLAAGHAALAVHDPTRAMTEFEQDDSRAGRAWLAVALMMESRAPSDAFVVRAFDAAAESRSMDRANAPRAATIQAQLQAGDMVVAYLLEDRYGYAWAIDRSTVIGYPLPPPDQLRPAAEAAHGYAERNDTDGLRRVGDELMSSLLGPVTSRLGQVRRVVFALDGALTQLPIDRLPPDADAAPLNETIATTTVSDYTKLIDALHQPVDRPATSKGRPAGTVAIAAMALLSLALIAWGRRRRRA